MQYVPETIDLNMILRLNIGEFFVGVVHKTAKLFVLPLPQK